MRFQIFQHNYEVIQAHNQEPHSFTLALNQFADLTQQEYIDRYLIPAKQAPKLAATLRDSAQKVSVSIDHTALVGRVKDQGTCGSCWAFGTAGALEFVYAVNHNNVVTEISEQHIVDCFHTANTNGCDGGEADETFGFAKTNGVVIEKDYPYVGYDDICKLDTPILFKSSGWRDVTPGNNDELLQRLQIQAIEVGVDAASYFWRFFNSGILDHGCPVSEMDHYVVLVGAGTENNIDYWLLKNSWGPNWGRNGFIYIKRDPGMKPAQCAMNMFASYPTYGTIN